MSAGAVGAESERVARDVARLVDAGVGWPAVQQLAVAVRLAGIRAVLGLGAGVVDGPAAGADAVRGLLERVAPHPRPHERLERVAAVLRAMSGRRVAS